MTTQNLEAAIYLRKSRDEEQLGIAETLAKHRAVLLSLVETMNLVLIDVYEEVVSGESLYARPEMMKLLEAVQDGKYDAVLCMDIDRLGRGGMSNQGMILDAFKYSGTKIITPDKLYDMSDETDEQLLEFKTFVSRQEYRQITKRLRRGLHQLINDGAYVANAPYGYRKTTIDKKPSLEIYEPEARFVRMMFDWYCEGYGATTIAARLNALGSVPHRSNDWSRNSVRYILKNPVFCGKIVWYRKQHLRQGQRGNSKHVTIYNSEDKWLVIDGLHEAIISNEQFELAKSIRQGRHFPSKHDGSVKSPLAGLVVCSACGRNMQRMGMNKGVEYLMCNTPGCSAGTRLEYVEAALLDLLREHLAQLEIDLTASLAVPNYADMLAALNDAAERLTTQKSRLCDLLEQGVYDVDVYSERMTALTARMENNKKKRESLLKQSTHARRKNTQLLRNRIAAILDIYDAASPAERNAMLKNILVRAEYLKKKKTKPLGFSLKLQYLSEIL